MNDFVVPDLFTEKTASEFFKDFISKNTSEKYSQRSFSKSIGWPVSYIPDLISGRRKFTIERSIQFGNFLKLNPVDFEKLIYLAIEDSCDSHESISRIKSLKITGNVPVIHDDVLMMPNTLLIFVIASWLGEHATEENIIDIASKRHISAEEVGPILQVLLDKGKLGKEGNVYKQLVREIRSYSNTKMNFDLWKAYPDFVKMFLDHPIGPSYIDSSFLLISESRFEEIRDRLIAFNNWMHEIATVDEESKKEDRRVYQLDLNFTILTHKTDAERLKQS